MLDITVTFLITLVNLGVLFFVLRRLLFKPIVRFMAERSEKLETRIRETIQTKERADQARSQYEQLLLQAEKEGEYILKEADDRAKVRYAEIMTKAESDGSDLRERQEVKLAMEMAKAKEDFTAEIAALAVLAASKAVERGLDSADSLRFTEDFVRKTVKAGVS